MDTWVRFVIQWVHTNINTAHKPNLSVHSLGPGALLFLPLGPTGLSGALPTFSLSFLLHSSCTTHHFSNDLKEVRKVMSGGTDLWGQLKVEVIVTLQKVGIGITFLVTMFPSSSMYCSSVTVSPGMFLAWSPYRRRTNDENHKSITLFSALTQIHTSSVQGL